MKRAGILVLKVFIAVFITVNMPVYFSSDTHMTETYEPSGPKVRGGYGETGTPAVYSVSPQYPMAGDNRYSTVAQGLLIYYGQQWTYYNNLAKKSVNPREISRAIAGRDAQYQAAELVRWEDRNTDRYKIKGADRALIDETGKVLLKEEVIRKDGTSTTGEVRIRANGQEENAEGAGQIVIPELYVYAKTAEKLKVQSILAEAKIKTLQDGLGSLTAHRSVADVPDFTMNYFTYGANNCVLTAVTRIVQTFVNRSTASGDLFFLRPSERQIYASVQRLAEEKYNYSDEAGVPFPTDIDNLMNDALKEYGFLMYSTGNRYFIDANFNVMKKIVDGNMPFLLNSSARYVSTECADIHVTGNPTYPDHTVTVIGYQEYSTAAGPVNLIKVYDGWSGTPRYIDYDEFIKGAKIFDSGLDGYSITVIK